MSKCSHCGAEPPEPDSDTDARALRAEAKVLFASEGEWTTWEESGLQDRYRALAAWCRRYFGGTQVPTRHVHPDELELHGG